ncbi:MAG TPA: MFS transporter [Acetobacteraceae bacterium]|nr:MFS transporter [Acetobacteraceae bacterium]
MLAAVLAPAFARRGVHYAWAVVAATFLVMLSTAAAMGMPGVLIRPLSQEFGWSTADISGALAVRLMLYGAVAPFAAALLQRHGLRAVVAVAMLLIVAGLTLATRMTALWQLWVCWGLLVGVGTGMTAMVLGATVATRWFTARRGLVVGMLTASSATGSLAFLPLAAWLAAHLGWRMALLPATLACLVAGVVMWLFGRDHPGELGLPAFGEHAAAAPPARAAGAARLAVTALRDAARTRAFWLLFFTFFVCGLSTNGLVGTHFIPLCQDFGMAEVAAAGVLAMMGAFDFVGTIGSGVLSDRFDSRKLLFAYYGLRGLSLLALPFSTFSVYGLSAFAVFYGLDWIATVPPTVRLCAQLYGRERAALVFGWVFAGHQLGAAVAALGGGLSRDLLASYVPAFLISGAMCLTAALAALAVRTTPPAPRTLRPADGTAVPA